MSIPVLDKLPFTLQCLPFGVISTKDSEPRCAVAIGDHAIDLARYAKSGRLADLNDGDKNGVDFEHVFKQVSIATAFKRSHLTPIRRTRITCKKPSTNNTPQPVLNTFAALDWKLRIAVREQLQRDLENGNVPEGCLLKLDEVKQHLPMQMQGFSDFYTSLEHCQNCSGQMAEAKIPKNWFYVRSLNIPFSTFDYHCHRPRR
jgi:fumarylacetoacetase